VGTILAFPLALEVENLEKLNARGLLRYGNSAWGVHRDKHLWTGSDKMGKRQRRADVFGRKREETLAKRQ